MCPWKAAGLNTKLAGNIATQPSNKKKPSQNTEKTHIFGMLRFFMLLFISFFY